MFLKETVPKCTRRIANLSRSRFRVSVVQNHVGQQFGSYGNFSVVVDQAQCPELVHKVGDPGSRCAHHFGQGFVTHPRHFGGRHGIVLAETASFSRTRASRFSLWLKS